MPNPSPDLDRFPCVLSLLYQIHECSQIKVPRHLGYWRSCAASWWCQSCCDGVSLYRLSRCLWHVTALVYLPWIVHVVDAWSAWGPLAHTCRTMSLWSLAILHEFMSLEPETVVKDVKRWLKRNYLPVISRVYFNLFAHICRNHQVCFLSFHFSFTFSVSDTWIPLDHVGSIAQGKVIGHIGHHMPQIDILTDAHMITHDKDIFTSNSHACSVNHVSTRSAWAQHESFALVLPTLPFRTKRSSETSVVTWWQD